MLQRTHESVVEEVVDFIETYGPLSFFWSDRERLRQEVIWFLQHDWTLLVREGKDLAVVALAVQVEAEHTWSKKRWPTPDLHGKILYVRVLVVHPYYRRLKLITHLLEWVRQQYPEVQRVAFHRLVDGGREGHLTVRGGECQHEQLV
jgi:hypothetical protein